MSLFSSFTKVAAGFLMSASIVAAAVPAIAADYTKDNPLKVALVLHGTLGDKSFFDDAAEGMKSAEADLPVSVKIIELGYDRSKWQAGLADAADSGYDVIIAGTFDMTGYITELSPQYPDVKFIDFDDTPDFTKCECKNVLGVQYTTAAAGYLAGYAAAKISKSGTLGTILGMEFPTVTDFKTGFDQGAKAANPNVNILNAVAGAFNDPAKGKEIALAQINQGADVVFPIAGGTGIGSLQAVKDCGLKQLVVAGGVGANRELRRQLDAKAARRGIQVFYPEFEFCTDNGAMIALAGALRLSAGATPKAAGAFAVRPRWPLSES